MAVTGKFRAKPKPNAKHLLKIATPNGITTVWRQRNKAVAELDLELQPVVFIVTAPRATGKLQAVKSSLTTVGKTQFMAWIDLHFRQATRRKMIRLSKTFSRFDPAP